MLAALTGTADARRSNRGKPEAKSAMLPSTAPFPRPRPGNGRAKANVMPAAPAERGTTMSMIRVPEPQWPGSPSAAAPARAAPEALPPTRQQVEPTRPPLDRAPPIDAETATSVNEADCVKRLNQVAVISDIPAIQGPGSCGVPDAVSVEGIKTRNGRIIEFKPHAQLRCGVAEAVVRWMRDDIAPSLESGSPLRSVMVAASYHCRARNNIRGARLSQHGLGMAMDVRAFKLADGTELEPTSSSVPKALRTRWRETACERFSTVLGPGSDGFHENHVHVDLTVRRSNSSLCRWNIYGADTPAIARAPSMPTWPRVAAASGEATASTGVTAQEKTLTPELPPGTQRSGRHSRRDSRREDRANARAARAEERKAREEKRRDVRSSRRDSGAASPPAAAETPARGGRSASMRRDQAHSRRTSRQQERELRRDSVQ
ncbi:hypothetical protein GJW-30_1_04119 [Variibacter gotjawalensis]|uniref:Extensin-like C-terminal domain-containing protein n=1 Tax=Variibacter gotjawalensis TaxID=1333996 RepID=A0A0S3Q054_9BRAD|nr:hypothetical protein EV661_1725 [Variibacter gotjawalensis]BAT61560.1 hypothetical protein GJW-30_1_04119 [Variibacter gotjawalensis]